MKIDIYFTGIDYQNIGEFIPVNSDITCPFWPSRQISKHSKAVFYGNSSSDCLYLIHHWHVQRFSASRIDQNNCFRQNQNYLSQGNTIISRGWYLCNSKSYIERDNARCKFKSPISQMHQTFVHGTTAIRLLLFEVTVGEYTWCQLQITPLSK
jgi:hypothetical protein